jgi:hypothetical protein
MAARGNARVSKRAGIGARSMPLEATLAEERSAMSSSKPADSARRSALRTRLRTKLEAVLDLDLAHCCAQIGKEHQGRRTLRPRRRQCLAGRATAAPGQPLAYQGHGDCSRRSAMPVSGLVW